MFGKLKEKFKSWTKKLSTEAEPTEEVEEKTQGIEETKEEKAKKTEKEIETPKETEEESLEKIQEKEKKVLEEIKELSKSKTDKIIELEKKVQQEKEEIEKLEGKEKPKKEIPEEPEKQESPTIKQQTSDETLTTSQEEKPKEPEQKKSFFSKITSKIQKVKITEEQFEVYGEELELLLLENNVAMEVAEKIIKDLKERLVGKELLKKEIESEITDTFKDIIREILIEPFDLIEKIKEKKVQGKPYVILFCGVNGTGKTTTIAKITQQIKDNTLTCVLAAADTFRAASIEQIKKHAERLNVNVISHEYNSDPAAVGFDAIKYAEKNKIDAVLIDTAGRMHTEKNLMSQIEKVAKVTNPDTKIFVGESITGNDIIEQVKAFDWAINGLDGIILTKADIDEKGGTALSVGYITKKPILYLGTGQEYEKIEPFNKEKFLEKLGLDED